MSVRPGLIFLCAVALAGVAILLPRWIAAPEPVTPDMIVPNDPRPADARVRYPEARAPALVASDGSRRSIRSLLNVTRAMHYGDYVWNEDGVGPGTVWVQVDLARQLISVFRDRQEIGSAVILYGTDGKPTPSGVFPVLQKARDHRSSLYDAEMPFMLRLTGDGVAIHASSVRRGAATHGCVGVPPAFAEKLFGAVAIGDEVVILPTTGSTSI
jgi:hypothetical protein